MHIEPFVLERLQSLHENLVEINLSDSGVHPVSLRELLEPAEIEALLDEELGYGWTNGAPALRHRIARLHGSEDPDRAIVTNGSAEANFLLVTTLLEPGDEFVVVTPNYLQMAGWARSLGVEVIEVPLDPASGWSLDLDALSARLSPRTRLISLCHPNNPTGSLLPSAQLDALVELADARGITLHADEVYRGAELEGEETPSLATRSERVFVTGGLSKAMALPGLRIGWLYGPADVIAEAWAAKDYTSITAGALGEAIALRVLEPGRRARILRRSRDWLRANLATLQDWVDATDGFSLQPPRAGGMAFLRYRWPVNSTALADALRERCSVLVVPGDAYGLDGHLRIGIGARPADLAEGLKRIAAYVSSLEA